MLFIRLVQTSNFLYELLLTKVLIVLLTKGFKKLLAHMNIRKFYDIRKSGRGFTDFWVCKKAVRYYGMGGRWHSATPSWDRRNLE